MSLWMMRLASEVLKTKSFSGSFYVFFVVSVPWKTEWCSISQTAGKLRCFSLLLWICVKIIEDIYIYIYYEYNICMGEYHNMIEHSPADWAWISPTNDGKICVAKLHGTHPVLSPAANTGSWYLSLGHLRASWQDRWWRLTRRLHLGSPAVTSDPEQISCTWVYWWQSAGQLRQWCYKCHLGMNPR